MGKVYSGLYECAGHVMPYLVVVKVGKPTERIRPGDRGKRDSQMFLMHFLNKVRGFIHAVSFFRLRRLISAYVRFLSRYFRWLKLPY